VCCCNFLQLDHDLATARQALAWHPDGGALLAVAGQENDVVLLERLSWVGSKGSAGRYC